MGRHNKDKRRAYLKREKIRKFKQATCKEANHSSDIHVESPTTANNFENKDNSHSNSDTFSVSSSSLWPTSSASAASLPSSSTHVKNAKSICTSKTPSSLAAARRGEIPRKVLNDFLVRKHEEYILLHKQLSLIKRRLNVIEYGNKGRILNQLGVDEKR